MHTYDANKTASFFNTTYAEEDAMIDVEGAAKGMRPRDEILLQRILPQMNRSGKFRILDYGCGQGRLVARLMRDKWDVYGVEKHDGMRRVALENVASLCTPEERILAGSLEVLEELEEESFDLVIAMGVFQYLPREDYLKTLRLAARLLAPGGHIVCTFQNALFDMFTFNKYTIDFLMNELLPDHLNTNDREAVEQSLATLLTNPEKPAYAANRARDNIYVRLTNPLTIDAELADFGILVGEKYFYEYFGLPPLLRDAHSEISTSISQKFEVQNATAWQGNFMANAFLVHATKQS